MTIIERMDVVMDERGLKAVDLAKLLDINPSVISTWRSRNKNPPAEYLFCICEFLDVSIEWLLTGQGSRNRVTSVTPVGVWEIQEYQRQAINNTLSNLTEEQALLLDNYEKLWPSSKEEVKVLIQCKLQIQSATGTEGRTEKSLA